MADISFPVNNLLGTAKSREVQRAILAEMRGESGNAALHFLAAGHMELVMAADFDLAGDCSLALRSRISAASCFWRAGSLEQARNLFSSLLEMYPSHVAEIQDVMAELSRDYPAIAS